MKLKKIYEKIVSEHQLNEGVYDKNIFKAFFLAGGPGSGKSYVAEKLFGFGPNSFSADSLKYIDPDKDFMNELKKLGINPKDLADIVKNDPAKFNHLTADPDGPREKGSERAKARQKIYTQNALGLVIDGTGRDYNNILQKQQVLKAAGYDTYMIFVNTSLDVAKERNKKRSRVLPDNIVIDSWNQVQQNLGKFQNLFGRHFIVVDNTIASENIIDSVRKKIQHFLRGKLENPIGKAWIQNQINLKNTK